MITREAFGALPPPFERERNSYAQKGAASDGEIDLRALLGTLLDRKWLIIAVTVVFFAISLIYVFLATPVYEAQAMVQVQQAPTVTGPGAIAETYSANNPAAADAISLLTSYSVVKKPVDDFKLYYVSGPYRLPLIGDYIARHYAPAKPGKVASPWLGLSRYDWGGSKLEFSQLEVPNGLLGEDLTLIAGENGEYALWDTSILPGQDQLLLRGKVGQLAKGSGITALVKTLYANPGTHFDVVRNGEAYTINQLGTAIQAKQPGKMDSDIIAVTLDNKSPHMAVKVLDEITNAYVAQNSLRNSAQASSSLEFVRQQLPTASAKLQKAQDALNAFQNRAHSVDVPMQTESLLTQIASVDANISQLEVQKAEVERLYTSRHPAYTALMKQVGELEGRKAALQKQVSTIPDTQRELLRLTGDVQVLNTTYTNLLNEAQQLEVAQAGTVGDVRIVDPASVDITTPVKPKKLITVLGATFLGGFLVVSYIFARKMLNRSVVDPFYIEQMGLPVYASIPLSEEEGAISKRRIPRRFGHEPRRLLALAAPADIATEAMRVLRTSLTFTQRQAGNNLLMISGTSPNAGKTFVSANLATLMSQSGKKVLLVDANLRDGSLHEVLGVRVENGLSELIAGQIDMPTAIRAIDGLDNLHFISRGRIPSYPSELLMDAGFGSLLRRLSLEYDLVVLDSPPILAVTDAAVIGRHAGTNILVVRFGVNESKEIELARQRFGHSGVEIHGVVFNAVEPRYGSHWTYDYYGDVAAR